MRVLPKQGDTVHVIWDGEYIIPFHVLYVTQQTYVGCGNETPHVPPDRQVILGHNERFGYKLIEVPKLYATDREARIELLAKLKARMKRDDELFDEAYRQMQADAKIADAIPSHDSAQDYHDREKCIACGMHPVALRKDGRCNKCHEQSEVLGETKVESQAYARGCQPRPRLSGPTAFH